MSWEITSDDDDDYDSSDDDDENSNPGPADEGESPANPFGEPPTVSASSGMFCSDDDDQGELDLNNQPPQGEIITPGGEIWEPPSDNNDAEDNTVQS